MGSPAPPPPHSRLATKLPARCWTAVLCAVLASCADGPSLEKVGLTDAEFARLHHDVRYAYFGGQGFDKAHLIQHNHYLLQRETIERLFGEAGLQLEDVRLLNANKPEGHMVYRFTSEADLDDQARPPTGQELDALADLRRGQPYRVFRSAEDRIALMAPVRAVNANCAACHGVPEGDFVGTFIYYLEEQRPGR